MAEITVEELEEFTMFAKIKDIWSTNCYNRIGLYEFLNNVVMNTNVNNCNGCGKMLSDLSDIYVLVSKIDFPFHKLTLKNKISIDLLAEPTIYVLGYIWLHNWVFKYEDNPPQHFINFINSRISGLNISKYMIEKYEYNCIEFTYLLPHEVILGSAEYWKKYFMEEYNIKNKEDLTKMISNFKLKDIKWNSLFSVY